MKLVLNTEYQGIKYNYLIRLPNCFDSARIDGLLTLTKYELRKDETIVDCKFYGDTSMSIEEKTQLDQFGEIVDPLKEIVVHGYSVVAA